MTPIAFDALASMTKLEDLSLKAENSKDLCRFLNENLNKAFKRLKRLAFTCPSREDVPQALKEGGGSLREV